MKVSGSLERSEKEQNLACFLLGLYDIPLKLEEANSEPEHLAGKVDCGDIRIAKEGSVLAKLESIFQDSFFEMIEGHKDVFVSIPLFENRSFGTNALKYAPQIESVLMKTHESMEIIDDIALKLSNLRTVLESMNSNEISPFLEAKEGSNLSMSPVKSDKGKEELPSKGLTKDSDTAVQEVTSSSPICNFIVVGNKAGIPIQNPTFESMVPSTSGRGGPRNKRNRDDKKRFNTKGKKKSRPTRESDDDDDVVVVSEQKPFKFKLLSQAKIDPALGQLTLLNPIQTNRILQTVLGRIARLNLTCMDVDTKFFILSNYATFELTEEGANQTDPSKQFNFHTFLENLLTNDEEGTFNCRKCPTRTFETEWDAVFHIEISHQIKVNCVAHDHNDIVCGKQFRFGRLFLIHFLTQHFRRELYQGYEHIARGHGKEKKRI